MRILLPSLLVLATACTASARDLDRQARAEAADQAALSHELQGLVAGPPQSCVQQTMLRESHSYGDTLVYRGPGRILYVNRTSGGCNLERDDAYLVTSTPGTSLCRGDIARAVSRASNFPSGSCSYGEFVPYSPPR